MDAADEIDKVFIIDEEFRSDFNDFIHCDDDLECFGLLTDTEIVAQVNDEATDKEEAEEEEGYAIPPKYVSSQELLKALEVLQQYFQAEDN